MSTLATALFDLTAGEWYIWAGQNPKLDRTPLLTFTIPHPGAGPSRSDHEDEEELRDE